MIIPLPNYPTPLTVSICVFAPVIHFRSPARLKIAPREPQADRPPARADADAKEMLIARTLSYYPTTALSH